MPRQNDDKNEVSYLKAKLFEKERIEAFLRAEVQDLWKVIHTFERFPLYKFYIKVANIYSRIVQKKTFVQPQANIDVPSQKIADIKESLDALFVTPSNNSELGGISSAYKLLRGLETNDLNVRIHPLNFDPTIAKSDLDIDFTELLKIKYKVIVICGSEAATFCIEQNLLNNNKSILFLQGPDFYFDSNWNNSENFIKCISDSDLVLAISPYMKKIAEFYGAKKVKSVPFGLDTSVYFMTSEKKEKIVLVPCRANKDKGTHLVVPILNEIKKYGWKVVGFGELPDINMAKEFDDFRGRLTSKELADLFRSSKALLDPSLVEGLGLVALESAACGCVPIVSYRHSYEDLFNKSEKPYIEIPNFLDPKLVVDTLNQIEKQNNFEIYSKIVLEYEWEKSFASSLTVIQEMIGK